MRSRSPSLRHRRRSRSRSRNRDRSVDRDFRPYRSRSRSPRRQRSRSRSRGRSRSRERYYSPDRPRHDHFGSGYEPRPHAWGPGAGDPEPARPGHWSDPAPPGRWNEPACAERGWRGGMPPWSDQGPPGSDWQEQGQHDWGRERSRSRGSGLSRGSDTDRDWEWDREVEWARRLKGPEAATASVFIKGLPEDADESVVHQLFAAYPNIQTVKVLRDRMTGASRGMAFLDFATADDARLLMESEYRWNVVAGGRRLLLDYSHGAPGSRGSGPADAAGQQQDWICDMCSAVNFARRLECYHCSTARPANPRRVMTDLNEPSNILKVSGLEISTSEEALFQFLAAVVPNILDMRVIKDKYTGAPRGFAFVELPSIADAGRLMVACQGLALPGQTTPLKICYAKAKDQMLGSAGHWDVGDAAVPGADAAVATFAGGAAAGGQSAAVSGWKPKEFSAAALQADGSSSAQGQPDGNTPSPATAAAAAAIADAAAQQPAAAGGEASGTAATASSSVAGPGPRSEAEAASVAAAEAAGVDAATIQAMTQAGFAYQASSGYWYDAKTGYFYDAKTALYYHHSTQQWYQYDHNTGQYNVVTGDHHHQQQQQQQQQAQPQQQQQQGLPQQQQQRPAADKRRRAVIGSAAQYNPEGLLAAAALAKEREEEQKRIAAAKAARERQQQQQNKLEKKQQLMPGKPGIGALPGTGPTASVPAAAAAVAPPPAGQFVAAGPVQGVVYKSKWAQRAAQQQR